MPTLQNRLKPTEILSIRAGTRARRLLAERGLRPADVTTLAAAAGGPKGLALIALDRFLFADWLKREVPAAPRMLVGASIGAWRFAAAARADADAALTRLASAYVEQRYSDRPDEAEVSRQCRHIVTAIDGTDLLAPLRDVNYHLAVITARARGALQTHYSRGRFALAAAHNVASRPALSRLFERVVFVDGALGIQPFDAFGLHQVALTAHNRIDALLASGTIPLLAAPVRDPDQAPAGLYWDGGLIDYHVDWPWHQLDGLVLYPHFVDHVVPGWLDKALPWRRARGENTDNLIVVAPSPKFLATLPGGRLPERQDFYRFGQDHQGRAARWRDIMVRSEALSEAFLAFAREPGAFAVKPF